MAPALPAGLIGREAAACVLLGAVLGGARALFPEKGRGAFLPDVLLVGALLLGLQSYAASLSFGGVLRWYQLAAAVFGAWAAERVLRGPVRGVCWGFRCKRPGGSSRRCCWPAKCVQNVPKNAGTQKGTQKNKKRTCQDHSGCCIILTYQSKTTGASGLLISGGTEL